MDKTPLKSKKFICFLISLAVLAAILVTGLVTQSFVWAMALFMCIGILGVVTLSLGYILSQRKLDSVLPLMNNLINKGSQLNGTDENNETME